MLIERVSLPASGAGPAVQPDNGGRFLRITNSQAPRLPDVKILISEDDAHDLLKGLANALL